MSPDGWSPFSFFLFLLSHVFQPTFVGAVSTAKNTALFFGTEVPPALIRLNRHLYLLSHVFQPTFVGAVSTAKNTAPFFGTEVPPTLIRLNRHLYPLSFIRLYIRHQSILPPVARSFPPHAFYCSYRKNRFLHPDRQSR